MILRRFYRYRHQLDYEKNNKEKMIYIGRNVDRDSDYWNFGSGIDSEIAMNERKS